MIIFGHKLKTPTEESKAGLQVTESAGRSHTDICVSDYNMTFRASLSLDREAF